MYKNKPNVGYFFFRNNFKFNLQYKFPENANLSVLDSTKYNLSFHNQIVRI